MGKAKDMSPQEWSRLERESRRRALTEAELRAIVRASSFGGAPGLEVVLLAREVRRCWRLLKVVDAELTKLNREANLAVGDIRTALVGDLAKNREWLEHALRHLRVKP